MKIIDGRLAVLAMIICCGLTAPVQAADPRAYMHGIEAVAAPDGGAWIFFSSSGLPPAGPDADRDWTHDVYRARWKPADAAIGTPEIFIQNPEAQEPVAAAQMPDGRIMLTFEDAWNTDRQVNQRYGVYGPDLTPVAPYPRIVARGGHSGHAAAAGNHFVVFYSEGWINKGGVDNLGTGNGVYARIYDSAGRVLRSVSVARRRREWWPMIAGSGSHALLAWQQYVPKQTYAKLKIALLDPENGALSAMRVLRDQVQYYTYKPVYVPAIDRFLVTGAGIDGKGFAYLIDHDGRIAAELPCMPPPVREAGITVDGAMAYTPSQNNRLLHLEMTPDSIILKAMQPSSIEWGTTGSIGLMRGEDHLHWVALSREGLKEADFDLREATEPTAADRCAE